MADTAPLCLKPVRAASRELWCICIIICVAQGHERLLRASKCNRIQALHCFAPSTCRFPAYTVVDTPMMKWSSLIPAGSARQLSQDLAMGPSALNPKTPPFLLRSLQLLPPQACTARCATSVWFAQCARICDGSSADQLFMI